jgi:DNA mismatch endonuclease (patch repair protein)
MRRTPASKSPEVKEPPGPSAERSRTMRAVKSRGNLSTEMKMAKILRANSIKGWNRHLPLFGRPDFAFRRERVALFVDGCFWHGCPRCYRAPVDRSDYWSAKVQRNRRRDKLVNATLAATGWHVVRVWEHSLKQEKVVAGKVKRALLTAVLRRSGREADVAVE